MADLRTFLTNLTAWWDTKSPDYSGGNIVDRHHAHRMHGVCADEGFQFGGVIYECSHATTRDGVKCAVPYLMSLCSDSNLACWIPDSPLFEHDFRPSEDWSIACWVHIPVGVLVPGLVFRIMPYNGGTGVGSAPAISYVAGTSTARFRAKMGSNTITQAADVATGWRHVAATWDESETTLKLYVDGVLYATSTAAAANQGFWECANFGRYQNLGPGSGPSATPGTFQAYQAEIESNGGARYAGISLVAWWQDRILTDNEISGLYLAGVGVDYEDLIGEEDTTRELDCCEPPERGYDLTSSPCTDEVIASRSNCPEDVSISVSPPPGTYASFPLQVLLYSNYPDAEIHYTTDGTDPTLSSAIATGTIEITGPNIVLRAVAAIAGCPLSDVFEFSWREHPDVSLLLQRRCTTADLSGRWNEFTSNGREDHWWTLQLVNPSNLDVKRFELYQMDTGFLWTTGQVWCTDLTIVPIPPYPQDQTFDCYPLVFWDSGFGAQIHSTYQSTFGTVLAGSTLYNLFGQPETGVYGYWLLIVYLVNGDKIAVSIPADPCSDPPPPPPCPTLSAPVVVPVCTGIEVQFTIAPAGARNYRIWRTSECDSLSLFIQITSGNAAGAQTYIDTTAVADCRYTYYFETELHESPTYDHCLDWIASPSVQGGPKLCSPSILSYTVDDAEVVQGGSTTLRFNTACGVSGSIDQGVGAISVNASGTKAISPPGGPGTITVYTLTLVGTCATVTAQVSVRIKDPGTCDVNTIDWDGPDGVNAATGWHIEVSNSPIGPWDPYVDGKIPGCCDDVISGCQDARVSVVGETVWDGRLIKHSVQSARYVLTTPLSLGPYDTGWCHQLDDNNYCLPISVVVYLHWDAGAMECYWVMDIFTTSSLGTGQNVFLWIGRKLVDPAHPEGVYEFNNGCADYNPFYIKIVRED